MLIYVHTFETDEWRSRWSEATFWLESLIVWRAWTSMTVWAGLSWPGVTWGCSGIETPWAEVWILSPPIFTITGSAAWAWMIAGSLRLEMVEAKTIYLVTIVYASKFGIGIFKLLCR